MTLKTQSITSWEDVRHAEKLEEVISGTQQLVRVAWRVRWVVSPIFFVAVTVLFLTRETIVRSGKLRSLRALDLSHNHIRSLPPQIGKCEVEWQFLQSCRQIFDDLFFLPQCLEHLDLDNNALENFPEQLTTCTVLPSIHFYS